MRLHSGLLTRGDVARARAEARDPRRVREIPQRSEVRMRRVPVEEDDRGLREQSADEEVPHHPARRREPEEPVSLPRVEVQAELLEVLEQNAALAVDDRLREAGRARAVQHPERVVEGKLRELEVGRRELPVATGEIRQDERLPEGRQ